ncbi:hypothetical protein HX867_07890 [Pseudomonas gingeri]|uniref:SH3 domain-containing protein n=1 Tax=Pseudomonas gingeri TaxID=117681 RepID=UPI0015A1AEE4|nr:SH3 domain-containing protein [Pseudomonas gingeri]NVZ62003.1 hypothetical protein [Pseudomonas gingeri]NVZ78595.1 hypothetical protein [Pseudomonas gingeri]
MERPTRLLPLACLLLSLSPLAGAADAPVDCDALHEKANAEAGSYRPPVEGKVIGKGRAYFHSAPSSACISKKVFVVPGDSLTVYASTEDGWAQVMYIAKGGEDFSGWVEENRVELGQHYGGDPEPADTPEQ